MSHHSKKFKSGYVTFVDLSKAFDLVDHFILGNKLLEKNVPVDIVFILMSYLRNQSARIKWNNFISDEYIIEKGVRQGDVISPLLFKLYIDCVIDSIKNSQMGCFWGYFKISIFSVR